MTSKEFVIWFKGFAEAANTYNITPKQWDSICDQLDKVNDANEYRISTKSIGVVNTTADVRHDITYNQNDSSTNTVF